jgi:hypothetical protein
MDRLTDQQIAELRERVLDDRFMNGGDLSRTSKLTLLDMALALNASEARVKELEYIVREYTAAPRCGSCGQSIIRTNHKMEQERNSLQAKLATAKEWNKTWASTADTQSKRADKAELKLARMLEALPAEMARELAETMGHSNVQWSVYTRVALRSYADAAEEKLNG